MRSPTHTQDSDQSAERPHDEVDDLAPAAPGLSERPVAYEFGVLAGLDLSPFLPLLDHANQGGLLHRLRDLDRADSAASLLEFVDEIVGCAKAHGEDCPGELRQLGIIRMAVAELRRRYRGPVRLNPFILQNCPGLPRPSETEE